MLLTYSMAERGAMPLYEFLYRSIRSDMEQGKIRAGEKMPSKRALASHLKISVVTVENAYAQLIAEGYLTSREKSGYYVAEVFSVHRDKKEAPANSAAFTEGTRRTDDFRRQSANRCTDCHKTNPHFHVSGDSASDSPPPDSRKANCILDLTSNQIDAKHFPFSVWSKLSREVLSTRQTQLLQRIPAEGVWELRHAISEYLYQLRGLDVSPEQIIIGSGTESLYQMLIQLFGRSAVYAVEDPGYHKSMQIYRVNDLPCHPVPLDEQGILMDSLRKCGANVVHISPAHHYPTGIVTSIGRRRELLEWASETGNRYILEDEYDSEFRFAGKPIPPLFSIDRSGRVIYMNTFSKSISPSIRISYLILPLPLLEKFHSRLGFYSCTVSSFEQYTLARFIAEGHLTRHVNRMKTIYRTMRNDLITAITADPLAGHLSIHEEDAGLHFLLRIDTALTDDEICVRAAQSGIRLQPMQEFLASPNPAYARTFVINYSSLSAEAVAAAKNTLSAFFRLLFVSASCIPGDSMIP